MSRVGRRAFLATALAAAAASCGPTQPTPAQPVTDFTVAVLGRPSTSTSEWWGPVFNAFNGTHPLVRATLAPPSAGDTSCRVGVPPGLDATVDLSSAMRHANLNATALLPGTLAAASDRAGLVHGIPIDFVLMAMRYSPPALAKVHLSPPPIAGWTLEQFGAAVSALAATGARSTVFGEGLATVLNSGLAPAWFGFAEGYGGNVFGSRVTLASGTVYEGLKAYAAILARTWAGAVQKINPTAGLGFAHSSPTLADRPWSKLDLARFPRLPVQAVPTDVLVAEVPLGAPEAAAGATFTVWLGSANGQVALTAIGYPPMRSDVAGAIAAFQKAQTGVRPSDLRFRPGGLFGVGAANSENFDRRIVVALLQPEPVRLARLKSLEQVLTGVLNGSMTRKQAAAMLDRQGVTAE